MELSTEFLFVGCRVECTIDDRGFVGVEFVAATQEIIHPEDNPDVSSIYCAPKLSDLDALIRQLQHLRAEYALLPIHE